MYILEKHGYRSLREIPEGFLDVYFSDENDKHGWDVPYICDIAEALAANGISADDLDDIAFHADMFGMDIIEAIENRQVNQTSWDSMVTEAMYNGIPEDDTDGFGYRSIWELDEE